MPGLLTARFRDRSDEYSNFSVLVEDMAGTDVWTVVTGLASGLESAVEALSLATLVSIYFRQIGNAEDDTRPASVYAHRERGLRFFYSDDVTSDKFNITLPAPDGTIVDNPGSDLVDLSITEVAALVTWIEANVVSPAGNAVTVDRAVQIGRNN